MFDYLMLKIRAGGQKIEEFGSVLLDSVRYFVRLSNNLNWTVSFRLELIKTETEPIIKLIDILISFTKSFSKTFKS